MKFLKGFVAAAALVSAVIIARRIAMRAKDNAQDQDRRAREGMEETSPCRSIVEETLMRHEGEDSAMRHAFEEALEEEHRYEKALARETGLRI